MLKVELLLHQVEQQGVIQNIGMELKIVALEIFQLQEMLLTFICMDHLVEVEQEIEITHLQFHMVAAGAYGYWNSPIVQPGNSVPYSLGAGGNSGTPPHGNFKGGAGNAATASTINLGPGTITINGGNGGNAPPNWNTSGSPGNPGNFSGTAPDQTNWSPRVPTQSETITTEAPGQPGRLLFFANDGDS
jgi:hypothetical protein